MTTAARPGNLPAVVWYSPVVPGDASNLAEWRQSVGPPVVQAGSTAVTAADRLAVVSWNVHVGGGDIARLFADVRRAAGPDTPIVFLLQEAYREGPEVPGRREDGKFAEMIRALRSDGRREDIEAVAASLGLHAYYVPSMRNGPPGLSNEDRGNAILSTVPLHDLSAIELPFERQRRVAVAASIAGVDRAGQPWRLRLVSAHFDTMSGARRLWAAGAEVARARQARGLLSAVGADAPVVMGADMNTLFGYLEPAYVETARAFPQTHVTDRRATFGGLFRLDHLFFRLPDGWRSEFRRADDRYGSDHYPLIGTIRFRG